MLTSNKQVRDWSAVFTDDELLTTAIFDRLLHHVQILHIDGRSYRLRELGVLLGPRTDSPLTGTLHFQLRHYTSKPVRLGRD